MVQTRHMKDIEALDKAYWDTKRRWAAAIGYEANPCPGTLTLELETAQVMGRKNARISELERENEVLRAGISAAQSVAPGPWTVGGYDDDGDEANVCDGNGDVIAEQRRHTAHGTVDTFNAAVELCRKWEGV